ARRRAPRAGRPRASGRSGGIVAFVSPREREGIAESYERSGEKIPRGLPCRPRIEDNGGPMLKLHHFDRSPFSWKVRMVLAEKNVPYQPVVPENKAESAEFARLNPLRLTPVLELPDGRTIYESTVVNEYLEEVYPSPTMLPKDPYERARVRILEDTADQYLYPALGNLRKAQYEYVPPYIIPKKPAEID